MDVFQVVKALRVHKPGAVPSVVSSSAAYIVGGLYYCKSQTLSRACTNPYCLIQEILKLQASVLLISAISNVVLYHHVYCICASVNMTATCRDDSFR